MSIYNLLHGVNQATFFVLPMLDKHPDEYPRFNDCFMKDGEIHILTRVGGANRNTGFGEEELQKHPNFLRDFDAEFDNTYAFYIFSVPEEWQEDYNKIRTGKMLYLSDKYWDQLRKVYPKLTEKFNEMQKFTKSRPQEN